jgi:polar amino acid transport system substrate-binding protein
VPIVEEDSEMSFVGEDVALGGGVGMGLRESDTELKEAFDAAITSMKEDGSLNELLIKWFGEETQTY